MQHNNLAELKNLGNTSINWLGAIGIFTREDLENQGPVEAFARIRARGFRVSKVLLYALHAALRNIHWSELSPEEKAQLVAASEQRLQALLAEADMPHPGDQS